MTILKNKQNIQKDIVEDRDQQILRRLNNIENRLNSLDQTNAFALRADAERHFESVHKIFRKSCRRVQIYLAANGNRSVQDISNLLGMKSPNVSDDLVYLQTEGLLEIKDQIGGKAYWGKKPIDHTIRISKLLMQEFKLNEDGLDIKQSVGN